MKSHSTIHFTHTAFGQVFYFKSTYYTGFESSKQLVPINVNDTLKMSMIRERQQHFDNECLHIVRVKNNHNYQQEYSMGNFNANILTTTNYTR